jgi:hypothetical protein
LSLFGMCDPLKRDVDDCRHVGLQVMGVEVHGKFF